MTTLLITVNVAMLICFIVVWIRAWMLQKECNAQASMKRWFKHRRDVNKKELHKRNQLLRELQRNNTVTRSDTTGRFIVQDKLHEFKFRVNEDKYRDL